MWRGLWDIGQLWPHWVLLWCTEDASLTVAVLPSLPTNTHLSSVKMSMYIVLCDCIVDSLSWLQPALPLTCHLHLCLCLTPDCQGFFFGASTLTSLKYLALFAVGEVRLVYSRWVISATMWSCCQVGWQSMDCLWITLCVCVPGLGTLWRTLTDWVSCASVHQMGPGEIPQKRVFFSLKMYMKNLSAFQLVFRIFLEKT